MALNVRSTSVTRSTAKGFLDKQDIIVVEEPLEIRVGFGNENNRDQVALSITMRTPGEDQLLGLGFLFNEGVIDKYDQLISIKHCDELGTKESKENIVRAELIPTRAFNPDKFKRNFYTTSSCGICGKASIELIRQNHDEKPMLSKKVSMKTVSTLPSKLLSAQQVFKYTGGLHASGLFDLNGKLLSHYEDIGRHNAADKLIGYLLMKNRLPAKDKILVLSGRISFELVQKAIRAGIPIVIAVGAPSSLAIDLAKEYGLTLIGFVRNEEANIYVGSENIKA